MDVEEQTLNLDYPCEWEYRVIGSEPAPLEQAIKEVMGARAYTCQEGRQSGGGKWITRVVSLVVQDENERTSLYEQLRSHEAVKIVL
ncbi:MAG: DUF493 domain-containing protein [Phycisphaerae bacterium]|nr:DUF493 domain-containing protein [Phycisphaerae bacterium]|tara:strand:+ start:907 stop:1167 length:261 start_codon:yes stop_codon:yes gene_type:complete